MSAYLVVLGHRDAIRWVLNAQRMAFPATPRAELRALKNGDRLYLYATRGAWKNPNRDRGRVIAKATATSSVEALEQPVELAGRSFTSGCDLAIEGVVPYPGGVELQPLVAQLEAFPRPEHWYFYLRRALVPLSRLDEAVIDLHLTNLSVEASLALESYPAGRLSRSHRHSQTALLHQELSGRDLSDHAHSTEHANG
ncbi:hypothetical protein GCM10009661_29030 [Catellatospora chokoriensis]|uniref:EVE domain-containing protein n=1 Tax=Catellatospora chokoriensis TaxID=310353 RepID=A0A8J3K5E0_9ACTN|nr:hypothetical protein Cch02nite_32380 [Catellatospora chokoriensis]